MMLDNGEPWVFKGKALKATLTCCDCGLNHLMFLENTGKKVEIKLYRDDWMTREKRKKMSDEDIDYIIKYMQGVRLERKKTKEVREKKKEDRINMQKTKRSKE